MTAALEHRGRWASATGGTGACRTAPSTIPAGRVAALVGPNGAGKTTLLHLAVGLLSPTSGTIDVLGGSVPRPARRSLLRLASSPRKPRRTHGCPSPITSVWALGSTPAGTRGSPRTGSSNSGSTRPSGPGSCPAASAPSSALTLAIAKRPELLLFDEPVASLDPLARREFLQSLMEVVAEHGVSVVLSSHLVGDLERVVRLPGRARRLPGAGSRVTSTSSSPPITDSSDLAAIPPRSPPANRSSKRATPSGKPRCSSGPSAAIHDPAWTVEQVNLEDLVLAYMRQAAATASPRRPVSSVPR